MLAVEEDAMVIVAAKGEVMNNQVPKYVTQAGASFMLGKCYLGISGSAT